MSSLSWYVRRSIASTSTILKYFACSLERVAPMTSSSADSASRILVCLEPTLNIRYSTCNAFKRHSTFPPIGYVRVFLASDDIRPRKDRSSVGVPLTVYLCSISRITVIASNSRLHS